MAVQDPTAAAKAAGFEGKTGDVVNISGTNYTMGADGKLTEGAPEGVGGATTETNSNTPKEWDEVQDARKLPGAGKYPNYWAHKTRSGHVFMMDDSKGAESVTLQHRGGSMLQIMPDGKVHIRAQNGQHTVVFGENRMYVTGAHDITVDGAASLVCKKDYNVTAKNLNFTAENNFNIVTGKGFNVCAAANAAIMGESLTVKVKKNLGMLAGGAMGLCSQGGFTAGSAGDSAIFIAQKDLGVGANEGKLMLKSAAKMSLKSRSALSIRADDGKLSMSATGIVAIDSDADVKIQQGLSEPPDDAKTIVVAKPE
jgi:hypothetical protein